MPSSATKRVALYVAVIVTVSGALLGCAQTGRYSYYNPNRDASQYDNDMRICNALALDMFPVPTPQPVITTSCRKPLSVSGRIECTSRQRPGEPEDWYDKSIRGININSAAWACMKKIGWEERWVENTTNISTRSTTSSGIGRVPKYETSLSEGASCTHPVQCAYGLTCTKNICTRY